MRGHFKAILGPGPPRCSRGEGGGWAVPVPPGALAAGGAVGTPGSSGAGRSRRLTERPQCAPPSAAVQLEPGSGGSSSPAAAVRAAAPARRQQRRSGRPRSRSPPPPIPLTAATAVFAPRLGDPPAPSRREPSRNISPACHDDQGKRSGFPAQIRSSILPAMRSSRGVSP